MKLVVTSILAFASSVLATLAINNPVAGTVWPADGSPVTISWVSSDGSPLTGTVVVQLMEGSDPNNLGLVATIATNLDAATGKVVYTPPDTLHGSSNYAIRVTSSVDGPRYSHSFQAGSDSITASISTAITVSASDESSSATGKENSLTPSEESSAEPSSSVSEEPSSSKESSSSEDNSEESSSELSDESSEEESSEEESSEEESSEEESSEEESSEEDTTSGATNLSVTLGLLGISAIAALV
ncbi:hypothetical protein IWW36_000853 [Coemansia brasiliensis]|uniref:Yeast cell wall synthesis Kre9/Knh1-like N-terminal domain-containing protein n=1 Tax=Coemansia brasiliensis TaxID=2650707 RepID=A0A9W8M2I1_9FUNG|nr:hypothetical protein IWW36_000853 [Coemansia brasiliensis]